jgi:hypothetical protein
LKWQLTEVDIDQVAALLPVSMSKLQSEPEADQKALARERLAKSGKARVRM